MSKRYFSVIAFSFFISFAALTPIPARASIIYDTTLGVGQFYIDSASSLTSASLSNLAGVSSV